MKINHKIIIQNNPKRRLYLYNIMINQNMFVNKSQDFYHNCKTKKMMMKFYKNLQVKYFLSFLRNLTTLIQLKRYYMIFLNQLSIKILIDKINYFGRYTYI